MCTLDFQQEDFMSGIANLFKGRNSGNNTVATEMAKDYLKRSNKAYKEFRKRFPEITDFACCSVKIKSLNFKDRKVDIDFNPEKEIYHSKCKNADELYENEEFARPGDINNDYWFIGREYDEIRDFVEALRSLGFSPMWKLDPDCNNYDMYPISFIKTV
jgi:hypothetical protein